MIDIKEINEQLLLAAFEQMVRDYAKRRENDVRRGAESPHLAALLVQKYGLGILDTAFLFLDTIGGLQNVGTILNELGKTVDDAVVKIDPLWREHAQERWAMRPADVVDRPED